MLLKRGFVSNFIYKTTGDIDNMQSTQRAGTCIVSLPRRLIV